MQDLITREILSLKKDIPQMMKIQDEYLFSLVCYKYFYNDGHLSNSDYKNVFVDGRNDGGIDLITTVDDSNYQTSLVLIQSKYISQLKNTQDIIDIFNKMSQTFEDFKESKTAKYSRKLKQKLKDKMSIVELHSNTELTLFINVDITDNLKIKIEETIEHNEILNKYLINIFYKTDIEEQIQSILEPQKFVPEAKIKFNKVDGMLKNSEDGILVNIYANSLRDLYDRFKDKGLFEQNFRYFVRNKKIDDNIKKSLNKKREEFWFLNNGIIIGCYDFVPDGEYIKLYNFSVINGCQTTTLIGEYKGKNSNEDFVLPCKIVKPKIKKKPQKIEDFEFFQRFISEIAESSNSQKPISDRDLKSNRPEQIEIQKLLKEEDPKIYMEIKKGAYFGKKGGITEWQTITNEALGQLVLSFHLQQPGTAKSAKKKIFADENIYSKIFKRRYDKSCVEDLLKLNYYYKCFLDKTDEFSDLYQESVANNGRLVVLSIIGLLIKHKRNLVDLKKIKDVEEWEKEIKWDNVTGRLFSEYKGDDFEAVINSLFLEIIMEISDLYERKEEEEKTVSNFFKSDNKYYKYITKYIIDNCIKKEKKYKEIMEYMIIFS